MKAEGDCKAGLVLFADSVRNRFSQGNLRDRARSNADGLEAAGVRQLGNWVA